MSKIIVSQAAKQYNWSRCRVYQLINRGQIGKYLIGGVIYVDTDEIEAHREKSSEWRRIWEKSTRHITQKRAPF